MLEQGVDQAILETASDRYVVEDYLAEGGMGAIYLGKKLGVGGFEKQVVLKQLLPEFTSEPQFIDLFLREARITASLDHANIVRTLDLVAAGNDYFIVMEYVHGGDLRTLLRRAKRRDRRLSPQAALYIGFEIADALVYAHAKKTPDGQPLGLIHRDVSPSNILLSGAGEVKLTDFGIAKASTHRSVFYKVKGKVGYMSPEQARGEVLDARSDLYSLAVCVFEALTGERLFVGDILSTPSMIYSQPVPLVSERCEGLPTELDDIMKKALALAPGDRFQSAAELQEALRRVAFRNGLLYSSAEMAAHLQHVCGGDVSSWLRSDEGDERGGSTELYSDEGEERSEWSDGQRSHSQLSHGTELSSVLGLKAALRASDRPAATLAAWESESTVSYANRTARGEAFLDGPTVPGRKTPPLDEELPITPPPAAPSPLPPSVPPPSTAALPPTIFSDTAAAKPAAPNVTPAPTVFDDYATIERRVLVPPAPPQADEPTAAESTLPGSPPPPPDDPFLLGPRLDTTPPPTHASFAVGPTVVPARHAPRRGSLGARLLLWVLLALASALTVALYDAADDLEPSPAPRSPAARGAN